MRKAGQSGRAGGIATHWERLGRWALAALIAYGAWSVATVYLTYWPQLTHLPALVARLDAAHHTRPVALNAVSPWFPKALIATEDRTFYTNFGVSVRGIIRSLWVDVTHGAPVEGGSTLTQQLVRDRLLGFAKTFRRKLEEALLALMVTELYSKREILTLYINQVYLGQGAYGVRAASRVYFARPPRALTLPEAALLAGLPQAPSALDPLVHYRAARRREWEVLWSMVNDHMISPVVARRAFEAPLELAR
jgi:membrane peptidoglycan carboxypeptidase